MSFAHPTLDPARRPRDDAPLMDDPGPLPTADDQATNILVVDDLPEKLLAYRSILDELGQNLVTARSGEEALKEVLRREFAVILLDVNMPGLTGLETAALIHRRKRSAHTPIIFLTAFADEVRVAEGYAQGAVDYISTPVVPEILRAKVRVFVDLYRMTQQVRRQAEERVALAEERTRRAAAEAATRRADFLADVSRTLADSLDPETVARSLARQAVPFLADLAGVTLPGPPGHPWRTDLAWAFDPDPTIYTSRLAGSDAPHDGLRAAVDRALAGGKPEHLDGLDVPYPDLGGVGPRDARIRSAAVFPLAARGHVLGALTLAFGPSGRRHGPDELALAGDLAARAAIALDNARLYKEVETADRQKNEFLSMLAHELRNPLAPIRNAVEVLRLGAPEHPQVGWARGLIDRQLTHLTRLVDDLLDVSRITRGKIRLQTTTVDLTEVVRHAVEAGRVLVEQCKHELEVTTPPAPVLVDGDPVRLAQVVTNLLNNAAKYTEPGGRIWLTVRAGAPTEVRVKDTGIGIPPDMLGAVFDLFTQADRSLDRSRGGLGVGLTLVKRLVEMHGGTVEARSEGAGMGSEFVVRLPAAANGRPAERGGRPPSAAGTGVSRRVVIVEDNPDAADSLRRVLETYGHQVLAVAQAGPEGIEAARRLQPDVVLCDVGLPGMSGYEVARALRADPATAGLRLVSVSGYGQEEDRRQAHAAGFDESLVKPASADDLRQALGAPAA